MSFFYLTLIESQIYSISVNMQFASEISLNATVSVAGKDQSPSVTSWHSGKSEKCPFFKKFVHQCTTSKL